MITFSLFGYTMEIGIGVLLFALSIGLIVALYRWSTVKRGALRMFVRRTIQTALAIILLAIIGTPVELMTHSEAVGKLIMYSPLFYWELRFVYFEISKPIDRNEQLFPTLRYDLWHAHLWFVELLWEHRLIPDWWYNQLLYTRFFEDTRDIQAWKDTKAIFSWWQIQLRRDELESVRLVRAGWERLDNEQTTIQA